MDGGVQDEMVRLLLFFLFLSSKVNGWLGRVTLLFLLLCHILQEGSKANTMKVLLLPLLLLLLRRRRQRLYNNYTSTTATTTTTRTITAAAAATTRTTNYIPQSHKMRVDGAAILVRAMLLSLLLFLTHGEDNQTTIRQSNGSK